jgi:hypothetical protein
MSKYGKYIITHSLKEPRFPNIASPAMHFDGEKDFKGAGFSLSYLCIKEPFLIEDKPMFHDFDQYLVFLGGDPMNLREFGAVAELSLGEEGEKHIINSCANVYIPKGLVHCPLNFTRVDKPIIFIDIIIAPTYTKTTLPDT